MRIHKRVVTLISPPEYIKKVTDFSIDPGVEVELHLTDV
jgi:small subunit ribosomal protein S20e